MPRVKGWFHGEEVRRLGRFVSVGEFGGEREVMREPRLIFYYFSVKEEPISGGSSKREKVEGGR